MFKVHELLTLIASEWGDDSSPYKEISKSVKFYLGDMDDVSDLSDISTAQFFELPAETCAFQFDNQGFSYILVAKQKDDEIIWTMFGSGLNYSNGIKKNGWYCENLAITVSRDGEHINAFLLDSDKQVDVVAALKDNEDQFHFAVLWIMKVIRAIEVFSLSNVFTVENHPPKFINAKRKKKGKIPFFSYHTLHIGKPRSGKSGESIGTHNSPRLHFRRGHIRKLADGRRIWVNACLVGDKSKGMVMKDYKVNNVAV